jgi:hypothetical protein
MEGLGLTCARARKEEDAFINHCLRLLQKKLSEVICDLG